MIINRKYVLFFFISVFLFFIAFQRNINKLTYVEYITKNEHPESYVVLSKNGDEIIQEFSSPYRILQGFSFKMCTFQRRNNSTFKIFLNKKNSEKIIFEKKISASHIEDGDFYKIDFNKNIAVDEGDAYQIHIIADSINDKNAVAFYKSENDINNKFIFNEELTNSEISFRIYGGERDLWWLAYSFLICAVVLFIIVRIYKCFFKKAKLENDILLHSFILFLVLLFFMLPFAGTGYFLDEMDNMTASIILANGGVLYRDYITQHMPVFHYICSIFAKLGASSMEQFRISYYIFESVIWGWIYYRYSKDFGKIRMFLLPIFILPLIVVLMEKDFGYGHVLAESLQSMSILVLVLEFILYLDDKKIGWGRAIIISLCIYCSVGSIFLSIYPLFLLFLIFVYTECVYIKNNINFELYKYSFLFNRYSKFILSVIFPILLTILYFYIHGSLNIAIEQFYKFNVQVYSNYVGGTGKNLLDPIIDSIYNHFYVNFANFNENIIKSNGNEFEITIFCIIFASQSILLLKLKKGKTYITEVLVLFCAMCFSAPRGYTFHGMAALYMSIFIIIEYIDIKFINRFLPIICFILIYIFSGFVFSFKENIRHRQSYVTDIENYVFNNSNPKDEIFIDISVTNPLYFIYKDRILSNHLPVILPWYMEWYEDYTIEEIKNKKPKIAVYNKDANIWGISNFSNALTNEFERNYEQLSNNSEDGWKCVVWVRKDN